MATHFEVFDTLREFAKSLDHFSKALPKFDDDEEQPTNTAKASLQLRAMLTEAQTLKNDVEKNIDDTKKSSSFDQMLALCEQHVGRMKEDIDNLEEYLAKYGYKKKSEELPEAPSSITPVEQSDQYMEHETSVGSSSGSSRHNSDKENMAASSEPSEEMICNVDAMEQLSSASVKPQEEDLMSTPVLPATMTRLMQDPSASSFPPGGQKYGTPFMDEDMNTEPIPPVTTTPRMSRQKDQMENPNFSTPDNRPELPPVRPTTTTPMIHSNALFPTLDSPTEESDVTESLVADFPTPPVFRTPGLQKYTSRQADCGVLTMAPLNRIETPSPPSLTSVHMMYHHDAVCSPTKSAENSTTDHVEPLAQNLPKLPVPSKFPAITQEAFSHLPDSIQRLFSLEQVNQLIKKTGIFLSTETVANAGHVTDEELTDILDIGALTRSFILLMVKLKYFAIVRNGLYRVL